MVASLTTTTTPTTTTTCEFAPLGCFFFSQPTGRGTYLFFNYRKLHINTTQKKERDE
jgi:hypothetical protein